MCRCVPAVLWVLHGQRHVTKFLCPPSAQITACCWWRLILALPWLPGCSIYRPGGGEWAGITLLLGGLRPSDPQICPAPPRPKLPAKIRLSGCRSSHHVLAPLGLCQAHPFPPTSWQRHGRAVCGWEPRLAHGPACQLLPAPRQATNGGQSPHGQPCGPFCRGSRQPSG